MFGEIARQLIQMMGHSGSVPGAIRGDNLQPALRDLQTRLRALAAEAEGAGAERDDEEPVVSLSQRAVPLLEMLQAAVKADSYVMWE